MKYTIRRMTIWTGLCIVFCAFMFTGRVNAQNFYGEGNVLIAVDMSPYAENDDVHFEAGTMGTLQWSADAATGESTRPAFHNNSYHVDAGLSVPLADEYSIQPNKYTVGKTVFLPYTQGGEVFDWIEADHLPTQVFDANKAPLFLIQKDQKHIKKDGGKTFYLLPVKNKGDTFPAADFIEIKCVSVTKYTTVWEYTGTAYSTRPGFSIEDYSGAVNLTQNEIKYFEDTCDEAYTTQSAIFGDPHFEDYAGDRDGKAAYVALDYTKLSSDSVAYYPPVFTVYYGFDCLVVRPDQMPGRRKDVLKEDAEAMFSSVLIHELNHYILYGCIEHNTNHWSSWIGEAMAQRAVCTVKPERYAYIKYAYNINNYASRLRMIPGMCWSKTPAENNPIWDKTTYAMGAFFLEYIERETQNPIDGRLWTDFLTSQGDIPWIMTYDKLDTWLRKNTDANLDAWLAQFMAAVVIGDEDGPYCMGDPSVTADLRVNPYVFYRTPEEFGQKLGFDGVEDDGILFLMHSYGLENLRGGGTVYAYRNNAGGKIAITGADDNWYFFAVNKDLSKDEISISSADELRKIGNDGAYPLYGSYVLSADIDLGGESHPWIPIGYGTGYFSGTFDGKGHTIKGLYISCNDDEQGLFWDLDTSAVIRDLNVKGSISAGSHIGGIVSYCDGGSVIRCTSDVTIHGNEYCGGIIGYQYLGTISDCTTYGSVAAEGNYCGGIAGYGSWTKVRDCRNLAAVNSKRFAGGILGDCVATEIIGCRNDGDVSGNSCVGGITGLLEGDVVSSISESYQTGMVSGKKITGGIAGGILNGTIQNCYNACRVSGEERTGGVTGMAQGGSSTIENCYSYQKDLAAIGENVGGEATATSCYALSDTKGDGMLTALDFSKEENFPGWDFGSIWNLQNCMRPILRGNKFKDTDANAAPVPNAVTPIRVPTRDKPDADDSSANSTGNTNLWTLSNDDSTGSGSSSGSSRSIWDKLHGKGAAKAYYKKTGKGTVAYYSCGVKQKAGKAVVPASVKIGKKTYRVTSISTFAFTGYDYLQTVTIGKNVTKIHPNAFNGCNKLTRLKVSTKRLTKQGVKNSLSGSKVNTVTLLKNAQEKIESYKKIFSKKNSGAAGKVTVEKAE